MTQFQNSHFLKVFQPFAQPLLNMDETLKLQRHLRGDTKNNKKKGKQTNKKETSHSLSHSKKTSFEKVKRSLQ